MRLEFDKMEGAGNDFILVDNRDGKISDADKTSLAIKCCRRRFGVGADGMLFVEKDPELDFSWDFYNPDGSRGEMCGNGARCVARYANKIGAAGRRMTFRTLAGPIEGEITDRGAKVRLTDVVLPEKAEDVEVDGSTLRVWSINTGVPHAVIFVDYPEKTDVRGLGSRIRRHGHFSPAGTNVNFIAPGEGNSLSIRTYERGVEDETLACGTGSVAASIVAAICLGMKSPVVVRTWGGDELVVHFRLSGGKAGEVYLEGAANWTFSGFLELP